MEGPGVGIEHKFSDALKLALAYRARNGSDPSEKRGLFDGNHGVLAQLTFTPTKDLGLGFIYTRAYFPGFDDNASGNTGSLFARRPFGNVATLTNTYGAVANFRVSPRFSIAGWGGFTQADAKSGVNQGADASI